MATTIQRLDASIARTGEPVILRRGVSAPFTDLPVTAHVRGYQADEIAGGIMAGDLRVIISATGLDNPAWIAATPVNGTVDRRIPKINDKIIVQGRSRAVQTVNAIHIANLLTRIEMQVRG
jgi:hypothetical protein